MPNDKHLPLCPFYKRHMNRSITCEDVNRTFSNTEKKEMWLRTYCDKAWEDCGYAKDLNEAYERLFKGDDKAIMQNEYESLKREIKKLSTLLGKSNKRVERQQKKIDELRAVNQSFVKKNDALYAKWRDTDQELREHLNKAGDELSAMAQIYEQRMCYLIDTFAPEGVKEEDVEAWAADKEFALVADFIDDGKAIAWKVVFKDDAAHDTEGVSGIDKDETQV